MLVLSHLFVRRASAAHRVLDLVRKKAPETSYCFLVRSTELTKPAYLCAIDAQSDRLLVRTSGSSSSVLDIDGCLRAPRVTTPYQVV